MIAALDCTPNTVFVCASLDDCGHGTCEATGYCSFPDSTCPSGHRYGAHASEELAGTCVPDYTGSSSGAASTGAEGSSSGPGPVSDPSTSADPSADSSTGPVGPPTSTTTGIPGTSTGPAESTGAGPPRVTDGLLVLYTFQENGGSMVMDLSGVDPPLPLTISGTYDWPGDGLQLDDAILQSGVAATKVITACQATSEFTLEAWITPQAAKMLGPGRIISLSLSTTLRNFTLGQGSLAMPIPDFVGRIRTSDTSGDTNGLPQLNAPMSATDQLTHVVYARSSDDDSDRIYVDATMVGEGDRSGDFSTWDPDYELLCGNELTLNRPWQGTLHLVAIYEQALTPAQIQQNFDAGF